MQTGASRHGGARRSQHDAEPALTFLRRPQHHAAGGMASPEDTEIDLAIAMVHEEPVVYKFIKVARILHAPAGVSWRRLTSWAGGRLGIQTRRRQAKGSDLVRHVIEQCKAFIVRTPRVDSYCLYWQREDDDDRNAIFLEADRPLSYYPELTPVRVAVDLPDHRPAGGGCD